jgi:hypothetical protein
MALGRKLADNDPNFKGYEAVAVKTGNMYKYILGKSSSREDTAKKYTEIKKKFPGSFIVKVSGNNVERL